LPSYTQSATHLTAPLAQLHSICNTSYRTPCTVTLNLQHILPHHCRRLLTDSTHKTLRYTTLCSRYCKTTKQTCRNAGRWSSGECNWWPVSRYEPLDTTPPPLERLANKKIDWPTLCYMSLLTASSR